MKRRYVYHTIKNETVSLKDKYKKIVSKLEDYELRSRIKTLYRFGSFDCVAELYYLDKVRIIEEILSERGNK